MSSISAIKSPHFQFRAICNLNESVLKCITIMRYEVYKKDGIVDIWSLIEKLRKFNNIQLYVNIVYSV